MRKSVFCKTLAMILSVLLLCSTAFFAAVTAFLGIAGGYTGRYTYTIEELSDGVLRMYAKEIGLRYADGQLLAEYYSDNNFYYTVTKNGVRDRQSNFNGQPFASKVTSTQKHGYTLKIDVYEKSTHTHTDLLSLAELWMHNAYTIRFAAPIIAITSFLVWICMLIFLFCATGHRKGTDVPMLNRIDRIPFDLYTAICAAVVIAVGICGMLLWEMLMYNDYYSIAETLFVFAAGGAGILVCAVAEYLIVLGYLLSFATRVKVGGLLRRMLIGRIIIFLWKMLRGIGKGIRSLLRSIPLVWKTSLLLAGISLVEFIFIVANLHEGDNILLWWIAEKLILCPAILYAAIMLRKLKKGGERIAAGDLTEKINTKYMPADFGDFGQTLNHIGDGLGQAVEERLRSERMKTELITNVSHDIKTPLTSIINYVDLIKKEEPASETIREYIAVLDRQSGRLKKLIEDLVEASKASTGAIPVEMARCEVGVLLDQTLGEYEEKLTERGLIPIVTQPEESICIMADGRRLWRVFDNLLNNICKYAQPQTRVYISLEKVEKRAVITFRNISRDPLNISSEELMERFVRGDASRNTEGSGLGLSIARSLVDLQGGNLSLSIDGDLFKATVSFDTVE